MRKYACIFVFCGTIFFLGAMYLSNVGSSITTHTWDNSLSLEGKIEDINTAYQDADIFREQWINLYGMTQKVLGKRVVENFTLFKTDYGKIESPRAFVTDGEIAASVENLEKVTKFLNEREIPCYYLSSILPIVDMDDVPEGMKDYSHQNSERLREQMKSIDVSIIDLCQKEKILAIDKENLFYKTDHHWTMETCFAAFQETIWQLETELGWEIDLEGFYTDKDNYDAYVKENSFLGSYGIKMGQYYAGKDDFIVYLPKFNTDFVFESYDENHNRIVNKKGSFADAFIEWKILDDMQYNNKYNAFANNGYVENRAYNVNAPCRKKVLLIAHSYGRPFLQYLSLCFEEVRHLDPQEGRYNDNYLQYIDEYEPDLVLIMTEFEGDLGITMTVE